ncbi:hypothetical protein BCR34DRAFT_592857 [Clohesyomyces aquaticus]|uniref:Uncharacterized protein n=1 Tax=Clohesyomyces aquaticus TaxID=1231657 RepID=A0A1Y1YNF5_9PLEO|nr:hypothetical protein BCR34DRAFT_592857 [Clohesyomyces aquaticus]
MAKMLGRSKSLRMLRGFQKDTNQQENGKSTPPDLQFDSDRLRAATPVTRADSRSATPDISSQRPRTSGGPGDRGKLFHKKVAPIAPLSDSEASTNFPFPSPSKSSTVLYTAEVHEDREGIIGIALGSPTMAQHWNNAVRTPQDSFVFSNSPRTITHISSSNTFAEPFENKQEAPKPKISRWKSFFGKKNQASYQQQQGEPFYKVQPVASPERADSHHDAESLDSYIIPRDDARSASPAIFKRNIRQSRAIPNGAIKPFSERPRAMTLADNPQGMPKASLIRSASSPRPPPKDDWNSSPTIPQVVISKGSPKDGAYKSPMSANGEKPLLDVDIPRIEMERYSVMFGSLLQPSSRSSNLLVRRQGNSEKLKPLNELSVKKDQEATNGSLKPQRRATSPSIPKSPGVSFSLFPQPTESRDGRAPSPRVVSLHRPRPLQRSKTAPASSPNRQNFPGTPVSSDGGAKGAFQDQRPENDHEGMKTQLLTPTPSTRHSFDSDSEEVTLAVASARTANVPAWKPSVDEPEWEIVSKPSKRAPVSQDAPSSAPLECSGTHTTPKSKTQIILDAGPRSADTVAPRNAPQATIGLARQVSVSRTAGFQRADLLRPVLVKAMTDSSPTPSPSSIHSERLVDRKPLTPTLVELKNRKSQRVQLVDA